MVFQHALGFKVKLGLAVLLGQASRQVELGERPPGEEGTGDPGSQ